MSTRGTALRWQLLRMGRSAARRSESGRTRFIALAMATVIAALTAAAFVANSATFDGRDARGMARNPVMAEQGQQPKALWTRYWEKEDGRPYSVVVISPLADDAPLPPGLNRWPGPGESYLSPALADGPAGAGFSSRYGKAVGRIGESGLATPGERLVYTRPTQSMLDSSYLEPITGYGSPGPTFGDLRVVEDTREGQLTLLMAMLLGLPAAGLTVAAARIGAHGYDRRARLLHFMGATRRARAWMNLGASALPVTLGAMTAALVLAPALAWNITLPWIDYTLAATDLRRATGTLLAAVLAAAVTVLATTLLLQPSTSRRATRQRKPGADGGLLRKAVAAACPCFLVLAFIAGPMGGPSKPPLVYLITVIGLLSTLPSTIGLLTARIAPRLAASARRSGNPGRLIAARTLAARPGMVVRLISTLIIAIGVIGETQLIASLLTNRSGDSALLKSVEGRSMATVRASDRARPSEEFRAGLPDGVHVVSLGGADLQADGSSSGRIIQAPCSDLTALGLPCPGAGTAATVDYRQLDRRLKATTYATFGETPTTVRTGPISQLNPGSISLLVFKERGQALDIPELKRTARLTLSTDAVIRSLAEATDSYTLGFHARWLPFLGTVGTLFIALAMIFSALSEFLRFARNLAPITVLSGHNQVFRTTAIWALALPTATAGIAGVAAYVVLAQPLTGITKGAELSGSLCLILLALTGTLAAATAAVARTTALREARSWRPRAD